jgi:hypothetical protein
MIGFIVTSWQLQPVITAHSQWLPKTGSIPYWTTSVFSCTATDLVLIYESVISSASVVRWLTLNCLTNAEWRKSLATELSWTELNSLMTAPLRMNPELTSYITSGRTKYKSPYLTVPLLFCVYLFPRNVCLASRWLAKDFRVCSFPRERVLPNRCLAMVIFVTM